jgi:hypothetical protein
MPYQHASAVYHLGFSGRIPSGRLIYAEDHEGGVADVYLQSQHAREQLVWELNWVTRHQVGYGLWRQRWTHEGRMTQPAERLGVAVSRWEFVPARQMPRGRSVFPIEEDGSCVWLIRSGCCTPALLDEMNELLERIAGDGLWLQAWPEEQDLPVGPATLAPLLAPPTLPVSV